MGIRWSEQYQGKYVTEKELNTYNQTLTFVGTDYRKAEEKGEEKNTHEREWEREWERERKEEIVVNHINRVCTLRIGLNRSRNTISAHRKWRGINSLLCEQATALHSYVIICFDVNTHQQSLLALSLSLSREHVWEETFNTHTYTYQ